MKIQKLLKLHRLMDQASDGSGQGQSSGGGSGDSDAGSGGAGGDAGAGSGAAGDAGAGDAGGDAGKGKPTDAEAKLLKEVMDKKAKLKEVSEKASALEAKLKEFEGIDVSAVKKMIAEQADAETKSLEAKGEWGRLKEQMVAAHQTALQAKDTELAGAKQQAKALQAQIAELTVGNSFAQSKFIGEEMTLTANKARVVYGQHFEFVDGKVVAFDKPAGSAERTMLVDASGEPLAFETALRKLVESDPDKDSLIKSKIKQGAGSTTASKTKAAAAQPVLTGRERIAAALTGKK